MLNPGLDRAYRRAVYKIQTPHGEIHFRIGEYHPSIDALLETHHASHWVFITACNPGSQKRPDEVNRQKQAELESILRQRGYSFLPGEGTDEAGEWGPEQSVLVLEMGEEEGKALAEEFGQSAIVFGTKSEAPRLLSL